MDLPVHSSIPVLMDNIDQELISLICTKIGMLMEDHSAQALMVGSRSDDEQKVCPSSEHLALMAA